MAGKQLTESQRVEIIRAYVEGVEPIKSIADRVGVAFQTVHKLAKKHGVPRRGRHALSDEQEREVVRRYLAGEQLAPLARQVGCHTATIRNIVIRYGAEVRPTGGRSRQFTAERISEILSMRDDGMTQQQIARHLGTSQSKISKVLIQFGRRTRLPSGDGRVYQRGYTLVLIPDDSPYASMRQVGGYVMEHRLVMAQAIGRPLLPAPFETVHHINNDGADNRLENLQLRRGNHGNGVVMRCDSCGSTDIHAVPLAESLG